MEGANLLAELVVTYEQSLDTDEREDSTASAAAAADFSGMLAAVVGPLQEMCVRSSEALNPRAASR